MFLVALAIVVISWLYLHLSRYGRYTYAVRSNSFAARTAGIHLRRHLTSVYVLPWLLAGLTGMVFYIRLGAGAPSCGDGFELTAIAAVVIGGVSLFGGVGRLTGTILGALILTVLDSLLTILNASQATREILYGLIVLTLAAIYARASGAD